MPRSSFASHPYLLGFDRLDDLVERAASAGEEAYPPFNVLQFGPDRYRIALAVAGFGAEELSVTVEEGHLVIRGRRKATDEHRVFLHRGIAMRQFQRSFVLAGQMDVTGASLDRGILTVDLERRTADPAVTRIAIGTRHRSQGEEER